MIFFNCVGCGKRLQIDDEWAGKLGRCCFCGVNSPVPGTNMPVLDYPKRSSRVGIIARMTAYPVAVLGFWVSVFILGGVGGMALPFLLGGIGALAGILFICWAGTNIIMWILNPKEMKLWKNGGGDPWFDTVPPPFNNDPDSTRYQELYRERLRLEEEGHRFD
jgi:hypothetical protein